MINYTVTVYFLQNSDLVRSFCSEDSERKRSCCFVNGHTRSFRQQQVLLWMKHKYLHVPLSQGYYVSSVPIKTFPFKKWQKNIVHHCSCNNSNKHQRKTMVTNALEVYEWRSVFCKQMPSQTLDGITYPSYEFGGKFKNSYKKWNFQHFWTWILGSFLSKIDCFKMKPALLNLYNLFA